MDSEQYDRRVARVGRLKWLSLGAFVISLIVLVSAYLNSQFPGGPSESERTFLYGVAALCAVAPAVWLVVESFRLPRSRKTEEQSPRVSGIVTAGVVFALCAATSGGAFTRAVVEDISDAIVRAGPPTAAEIAYTPQELEAEVDAIVTGSLRIFSQDRPTQEDYLVWDEYCETSNGHAGTSFRGAIGIPATDVGDTFGGVATAGLEAMGLTVTTAQSGLNEFDEPYVAASGGVMKRMDFVPHPDRGEVGFVFRSVCVINER